MDYGHGAVDYEPRLNANQFDANTFHPGAATLENDTFYEDPTEASLPFIPPYAYELSPTSSDIPPLYAVPDPFFGTEPHLFGQQQYVGPFVQNVNDTAVLPDFILIRAELLEDHWEVASRGQLRASHPVQVYPQPQELITQSEDASATQSSYHPDVFTAPSDNSRERATSGTSGSLAQPNTRNVAVKKYICTHDIGDTPCGRSFVRKSDLWKHTRYHIPECEWPVVCQTCGKRFLFKKDLVRHEPMHSTVRVKYPCLRCGKLYTRKEYVRRHLPKCPGGSNTASTCSIPSSGQSSRRLIPLHARADSNFQNTETPSADGEEGIPEVDEVENTQMSTGWDPIVDVTGIEVERAHHVQLEPSDAKEFSHMQLWSGEYCPFNIPAMARTDVRGVVWNGIDDSDLFRLATPPRSVPYASIERHLNRCEDLNVDPFLRDQITPPNTPIRTLRSASENNYRQNRSGVNSIP